MTLEYKDIVAKFEADTDLGIQQAKVSIMFLGPNLKSADPASKIKRVVT